MNESNQAGHGVEVDPELIDNHASKYPEPPYRKEIPKPDYAPALRYDIKEDEL